MAPSIRQSGPAWDIAQLFPDQGEWDETEYLELTRHTNRLVEFCDGHIEVLPMPTTAHQRIQLFLLRALLAFVEPRELGEVLTAALRVRLRARLYREPDIVFMLTENSDRVGDDYWDRADLVMEIVSRDPKDRDRDLVKKRTQYAQAGIPEYWIVDEREQTITILVLKGKRRVYSVHGRFTPGQSASSLLLKGFEVDVAKVFAAARRKATR